MSLTVNSIRSLKVAPQRNLKLAYSTKQHYSGRSCIKAQQTSHLTPTSTFLMPTAAHSSKSVATQRSQAIARHFSTTTQDKSNMNLYSYSKTPSEYAPRTVGQPHTLDYRCYIEKNGQPLSPFHDIPLYANEQQTILNMVVEIPRWSNAKQEV